jgi:hypothetical protein
VRHVWGYSADPALLLGACCQQLRTLGRSRPKWVFPGRACRARGKYEEALFGVLRVVPVSWPWGGEGGGVAIRSLGQPCCTTVPGGPWEQRARVVKAHLAAIALPVRVGTFPFSTLSALVPSARARGVTT